MEAVKINRGNAVYEFKDIETALIKEEGDKLLVVFNEKVTPKVVAGSELAFIRDIYIVSGDEETLMDRVTVSDAFTYTINGISHDAVYTTIPNYRFSNFPSEINNITVKASSAACLQELDAFIPESGGYLTVKTTSGFGVNTSVYYSAETPFFIFEFEDNHDIFPQDLYIAEVSGIGYSMSVYNAYGGKIGEISGITIPFENSYDTIQSSDTITYENEKTCGYSADYRIYDYVYSRPNFARKKIKFTLASTSQLSGASHSFKEVVEYLVNNGRRFVPKFNRMYYYSMENISEKNCTLWTDPWWNTFKSDWTRRYKNDGGDSKVRFGQYSAYWSVPSLQFSSDKMSLGEEDDQRMAYVDDIIAKSIPDVIDMERLKYKPVVFYSGGTTSDVQNLIFDFHFRQRDYSQKYKTKDPYVSYPYYGDQWAITDDAKSEWNGYKSNGMYNPQIFNSGAMKTFIEENGTVSDALGYLGFTEEDVYYRKSKLSKSFVRLSFYDSTDPIEQKLLYYSTIFLDTTALFGRYMNIATYKENNGLSDDRIPLVFFNSSSMSARLDTELVINDEYNMDKSSEGFNIYLFADDAMGVNSARTIYMKVEFNHAGYGKTIPMLLWPKFEIDATDEEETRSEVLRFANVLEEDDTSLLVNEETRLRAPVPVCNIDSFCNRTDICSVGGDFQDLCNQRAISSDMYCDGDCSQFSPCDVCTDCNKNYTCPSFCASETDPDLCLRVDGGGGGGTVEAIFSGYTHDYYTDEPIEGIRVVYYSGDTATTHASITDSSGRFSIIISGSTLNLNDTLVFSELIGPHDIPTYSSTTVSTKMFMLGGGKVIYMMPINKPDDAHDDDGGGTPPPEGGADENKVRYLALTTENYLQSLYIPIEIRYVNGEYVYSINGANFEDGNKTIRLILFEPKLYNDDL